MILTRRRFNRFLYRFLMHKNELHISPQYSEKLYVPGQGICDVLQGFILRWACQSQLAKRMSIKEKENQYWRCYTEASHLPPSHADTYTNWFRLTYFYYSLNTEHKFTLPRYVQKHSYIHTKKLQMAIFFCLQLFNNFVNCYNVIFLWLNSSDLGQ